MKPGIHRASALAMDAEMDAAQLETMPPECEDPERFRGLVARALPSLPSHRSPKAGEAETCAAPDAVPDPVPEGLAEALWKRLEFSRRREWERDATC